LHETQLPLQATLQQTPSAQKPEAQSSFVLQTAPRGLGPQLPATHFTPPAQSLSLAHVAKHWPFEVSQPKGAHTVAGPGRHRPSPSHTSTPVTDAPSQAPGAHTVPARCLRQAPAPLHVPSRPHTVASVVGHIEATRGAMPFGTKLQIPGEPGALQVLQVSPHAALQQMPSTQKPLWQSAAHPQACPFALFAPGVGLQAVGGPSPPSCGLAATPPQLSSAASAQRTRRTETRRGS
jgi:hypothetical protein